MCCRANKCHYFAQLLCDCWCECGVFLKVNKEDLVSGKKVNCGSSNHSPRKGRKFGKIKKTEDYVYINKRIKSRYNLLLHGRKNGKCDIHLSLSEYQTLAQNKYCHYCGEIIEWLGKSNAYYLDRKDNNVGYSFDNCVVCCSRCNMAKGNRFTYQEWLEIGNTIKYWKNKPNVLNSLQDDVEVCA